MKIGRIIAFAAGLSAASGANAGVGYNLCQKGWASGDFDELKGIESKEFCECLGGIYEEHLPDDVLKSLDGFSGETERNDYARDNIPAETIREIAETMVKTCAIAKPAPPPEDAVPEASPAEDIRLGNDGE